MGQCEERRGAAREGNRNEWLVTNEGRGWAIQRVKAEPPKRKVRAYKDNSTKKGGRERT